MRDLPAGGPALSTPRQLFVTDGQDHYRVTRDWARFPADLPRGRLSQLAVLADGRVAICQRVDPAIVLFHPDGSFDRAWHHPSLASVHGIAATPANELWLTSFDLHQVLRFSADGALLQEIGAQDRPAWGAPFNHPTDVAVAADGEVFVSDGYANCRTHRFARDGRLLAGWGEPGRGVSQFTCPHGIWFDDARDRVLVLDRDNDRVCVFGRDGTPQGQWGNYRRPMDIWSDGTRCWIPDQTPSIWCVSAEDGAVVGRMRAFCVYPHGIWGDGRGNLFVAAQQPDSVHFYERITP
jgi:DNA-binding beta-propeller fold protein YncE